MAEATLLFGLGATKAGASWLHRYLATHPECYLRSIAKLHFFDTIDEGRVEARRNAIERDLRKLDRLQAEGRPAKMLSRAHRMVDLKMYGQVLKSGKEADYLAYLNDGRGDARLIADITPAYSLLSVGRLEGMAGMSADVRFVYLLRDPVARLWSHVRMIARRRSAAGEDIAERAGQVLERALNGDEEHIIDRGDYRAALGRMTAAIDPKKLFVAFYEELFTNATIGKLCAFLGIAERPGRYEHKVHEGAPAVIGAEQRARAAEFLHPQYDYVEAFMGRVPAAWGENRGGLV